MDFDIRCGSVFVRSRYVKRRNLMQADYRQKILFWTSINLHCIHGRHKYSAQEYTYLHQTRDNF